MGSTSWHDNILQALLIGLVVHIIAYVLCVFCAFLWASWRERTARPETGESVAEFAVEMGTVNVGEGTTILGVGDDGNLANTEDAADMHTGASTPEIPTVHGSSTQGPMQENHVTEDVKRRDTVPIVVDVSQPQQVGKVLAG